MSIANSPIQITFFINRVGKFYWVDSHVGSMSPSFSLDKPKMYKTKSGAIKHAQKLLNESAQKELAK